jgi:hypothetical protein
MSSPSGKERAALEAVVARAAVDPEFRSQLLTDPRQAIERAFGVKIPPTFRIRFIERDADVDALIVLPDFEGERSGRGGELSESDLEAVVGGAHEHVAWAGEIARGVAEPPANGHGNSAPSVSASRHRI